MLRELCDWREQRARESNLPRRWLADDKTLISLARAQPQSTDELAHFRGLGAKTVTHGGDAIVAAVRRGLEIPESDQPKPPRRMIPEPGENQAVSLLKAFVTELARDLELAGRFLMEPEAAVRLVRAGIADEDALRESGCLSAGAFDLIGVELASFLRGERALRYRAGHVERLRVDPPE